MTEQRSKDIKLGVVLPCFNEELVLSHSIEKISKQINEMQKNNLIKEAVICLIDDGSKDNTWNKILELQKKNNLNIVGIKFSKNFGHQYALFAGISYFKNMADCVISLDVDLEQDVEKIPSFVESFLLGNDIVLGIRNDRKQDSFIKKITAKTYYQFTKFFGMNMVYNHADYRLISKKVAKEISNFQEYHLFLRSMISGLGFKQSKVYFDVTKNKTRQSKYSFFKMLSLGINGITSYSVNPLRVSTIIGLLTMIFSFVMVLVIFFEKLFLKIETPGWASTVLPIYLIGGVNMFFLGVIGEYIGKIFLEVKKRPKYIIEKISER